MSEGPDEPAGPKAVGEAELFELIVESLADFAIFTTDPAASSPAGTSGPSGCSASGAEISAAAPTYLHPGGSRRRRSRGERRARTNGRAEDERWHMRKDGSRFWASGLLMPLKGAPTASSRSPATGRSSTGRAQLRKTRSGSGCWRPASRSSSSGPRDGAGPGAARNGSTSPAGLEDSLGEAGSTPSIRTTARRQGGLGRGRGTGEYYVEHRVRRSGDGEYRWHQTRARPLRGTGGRATGSAR